MEETDVKGSRRPGGRHASASGRLIHRQWLTRRRLALLGFPKGMAFVRRRGLAVLLLAGSSPGNWDVVFWDVTLASMHRRGVAEVPKGLGKDGDFFCDDSSSYRDGSWG